MLDRSRCIVIVPIYQHVEKRCEESLRALERIGYRVWRRSGTAAIDVGRSTLATAALEEGYSEIMWIDSDVEFPPDAIDHLRDLDLPIVGGAYPKKAAKAWAFNHLLPKMEMGEDGGVVEVRYLAAGFMHTRREIYEKVIQQHKLPLCNRMFPEPPFYPFFAPQIIPFGDEHWYLPEDYSFCHRVRECGFDILLDTRIRLSHLGTYGYSWEDACGGRDRYDKFTVFTPKVLGEDKS